MIFAAWSTNLLWILAMNTVVAMGLAVLAILAARVLKSPSLSHGLWLLVLIKLFTPPLIEVPIPVQLIQGPAVLRSSAVTAPADSPRSAAHSPSAATAPVARGLKASEAIPASSPATLSVTRTHPATGPTSPPEPVDWASWVLGLWLIGAFIALALGVSRALRFHRELRHARRASRRTRCEAGRLSRRLGLKRTPRIRLIAGKLSPMLWGLFGRAQILFPLSLEAKLSPLQKRALLAHELAHMARRDHWVRNIEMLVRAVYWWNPLTRWMCRELRAVEEECCDAWVVWALPDARRGYADALLNTVEFLSGTTTGIPAPASGAGTSPALLTRRLMMIMQGANSRKLTQLGRAAVFGLALLVLPLFPTFGEKPETEKKRHAALEHGVELLQKVGREQDAEVLSSYLRQSGKRKLIAALKRSTELLNKTGQHEDAKRIGQLTREIHGRQHRWAKGHSEKLVEALKRAGTLLSVVDREGQARLLWDLAGRIHKRHASKKDWGKKDWDKKKDPWAGFHAQEKKLEALVRAGKMTRGDAHKKLVALKKAWALKIEGGRSDKRWSKMDEAVKKRIGSAVEAGKLSETEARARWAAYLERAREGQRKDPSRLRHTEDEQEQVGRKLKAAVARGEMTEEEAMAHWERYQKKMGHERNSEGKGSGADATLRAVKEEIWSAVKAGKLTEDEARRHWEAYLKRVTVEKAKKRK